MDITIIDYVEHPIAPTAVGDVICAGEEATLSATAEEEP